MGLKARGFFLRTTWPQWPRFTLRGDIASGRRQFESFLWGGKDQYFEAGKDSEKLSKIVGVLKNEFNSAGLKLSSFDLDDLTKAVIPRVNELLYDTLAYIVKTDSAAEHFLLGTDSVSDRDGRRALLDLIKGCVPPAPDTASVDAAG
ncbi:hypothetical protein CYMTET_27083 [Cymbomonas tetramitiformis]|uniref:Uncharacterized protein n=1 Tax=Cymbomonas tetramitiformis TaxID=36881 RepID=A0AAE0KXL5_9CHLO|nr:hypothetical protein CYMTET_27083 [Cymbomonas tetramitiformis]